MKSNIKECDFFVHKSCAELPKRKQVFVLFYQDPSNLILCCIFTCPFCGFMYSGFTYKQRFLRGIIIYVSSMLKFLWST
ncbi:Zinc finger, PHD-type [Gossypium australe]|uniref:Zinc finger, PHD-type n=1 Tax=Gossypium australe TaxID=47621 RepID=A0A5B6WJA1_9ROSI|nr:Zinc finger, PHD-type [Gossypium australe]